MGSECYRWIQTLFWSWKLWNPRIWQAGTSCHGMRLGFKVWDVPTTNWGWIQGQMCLIIFLFVSVCFPWISKRKKCNVEVLQSFRFGRELVLWVLFGMWCKPNRGEALKLMSTNNFNLAFEVWITYPTINSCRYYKDRTPPIHNGNIIEKRTMTKQKFQVRGAKTPMRITTPQKWNRLDEPLSIFYQFTLFIKGTTTN